MTMFTKFTRSEKTEILDPKKVQTGLKKVGKKSVQEMTEEERKKFVKSLEK